MAVWVAADFDDAGWAAWWPQLQAAMPQERLLRSRADVDPACFDVAIVANPPPGSLRDLPALGLVQSLWAGVDRLLADPTVPATVPIARMVDPAMNAAMAQTALWAVTGLQRYFFGYLADQRRGAWRPRAYRRPDEVTVAVLGMGQMGRATASRLSAAGHRVVGWHRSSASPLRDVLAQASIVVDLLPLTPETLGLFDAKAFAALPRGASFVNLARGAHVVERDLLAALDDGWLRHAVLDVFAVEPLPIDHPFWSHPSVTVLPHVAAPTDPRSAAAIAAGNIAAWRAGLAPSHLVDRTRGY